MDQGQAVLLEAALSASVPLFVDELKRRPLAELVSEGPHLAQVIVEHGDNILYRGKKKGETATAFNALARALAIMSFMPGGVRFGSLHFES